MARSLFKSLLALATLGVSFVGILAPPAYAIDCYKVLTELRYGRFAGQKLGDRAPVILRADGTEVPIARAFEKEGLLYRDIAKWFPSAKPEATDKLRARLKLELSGKSDVARLTRWLGQYVDRYRPLMRDMPEGRYFRPAELRKMKPTRLLDYILSEPDFFRMINVAGSEALFYDGILTFDDLAVSDATPRRLVVGDDLGSYEVRSDGGTVDRTEYDDGRRLVEDYLESKVGHQHKVHAWPDDPAKRELMAPYYIELLDAGTWYLYWRQLKRDPGEIESVLSHPYLGVYTHSSLEKLYEAVVHGDPQEFKNKYRMIGARNFKPDPRIPEQEAHGKASMPDWELRSGNKTDNRDFVEDMIEARIATGDYTGLRDFRDYRFDPGAPIEALAYRFLNAGQLETLRQFEESYPLMKYSRDSRAYNHFRTKIIAPLLPWDARLDIAYKRRLLDHEQGLYAKRLYKIAAGYVKKAARLRDQADIAELRADTLEALEKSEYKFARIARLDLDFERYLTPEPTELPSITVPVTGPIDVNKIALGIEYSFRFPSEIEIDSKEAAEHEIQRIVLALRDTLGGGRVEKLDSGTAHGHGASVRYRYIDPYGRVWRAEWDGIQRSYVDGELALPHGGHIEVPTPKFVPTDARTEIQPLFAAARLNAQIPRRTAGGGHVNTDLSELRALPGNEGVEKVKSIIGWWESNREMATFLWQSPQRAHAARPVDLKPDFAAKLAAFHGDWYDLARFLYEERYFNVYVGRKPRYTEWNLTALIAPAVPEAYRQGTLDIRNPTQQWYPDFGKGTDRVECRFYDAPPNEYFAALQIKYHRAMLNAMLNSPEPVPLIPAYPPGIREVWRADPVRFVHDVEEHLRGLGLDPEEFKPLIYEAWEMQQDVPSAKDLKSYDDQFLPPAPRPDAGTPPPSNDTTQNWLDRSLPRLIA